MGVFFFFFFFYYYFGVGCGRISTDVYGTEMKARLGALGGVGSVSVQMGGREAFASQSIARDFMAFVIPHTLDSHLVCLGASGGWTRQTLVVGIRVKFER